MYTQIITTNIEHELAGEREPFSFDLSADNIPAEEIMSFAHRHIQDNVCNVLGIDEGLRPYIKTVQVYNLHTFFKNYYYVSRNAIINGQRGTSSLGRKMNYAAKLELTLDFKTQRAFNVLKIKNPALVTKLKSLQGNTVFSREES